VADRDGERPNEGAVGGLGVPVYVLSGAGLTPVHGLWWASWSPLVETAVRSDAVSWTRTSRSKTGKPCELGWLDTARLVL
jgi:hypothetical protein